MNLSGRGEKKCGQFDAPLDQPHPIVPGPQVQRLGTGPLVAVAPIVATHCMYLSAWTDKPTGTNCVHLLFARPLNFPQNGGAAAKTKFKHSTRALTWLLSDAVVFVVVLLLLQQVARMPLLVHLDRREAVAELARSRLLERSVSEMHSRRLGRLRRPDVADQAARREPGLRAALHYGSVEAPARRRGRSGLIELLLVLLDRSRRIKPKWLSGGRERRETI